MTLNCYENLWCFLHISKLVLEPEMENQPPSPLFKPCAKALQPQECLEDFSEDKEPIEDGNI